jgi:acyl carrier protein
LTAAEERVAAVLAIARDVLRDADIDAEDALVARGATSLPLVRIVAAAARDLDVDLDPRRVDGPLTARALALAGAGPS